MPLSPFEIQDALDNMVIYTDTREKPTKAAERRYSQFGCKHERVALSFGDYSAKFPLPSGEWFSLADKVVVERKMHIDELCNCYCQSRQRFTSEFVRAAETGAKIYLLIEDASWENIYNGKYRSQMRETALVASILAWSARYNCIPIFCKAETSGKLIKDILYREGKERMENKASLLNYDEAKAALTNKMLSEWTTDKEGRLVRNKMP